MAEDMIRAFAIGDPIAHSRSPKIHGYWLKSLGMAGSYEGIHVRKENLAQFAADLKSGALGLVGGNITIPHKEAIFSLADSVDDTARKIGAANTIWREGGRLHVTNTDSYGFAANLDDRSPGWDAARKAVVLGAGGASRAVLHALIERGFERIDLVNRTLSRAENLAGHFGPTVRPTSIEELPKVLIGAELFVNTSSLGMDGGPVPKIDFSPMASGSLVTDIVYLPLKTALLAQAEDQGFKTVDGLGMLLHQAVPGFEIWFGQRPSVTPQLRDLIVSDLGVHE